MHEKITFPWKTKKDEGTVMVLVLLLLVFLTLIGIWSTKTAEVELKIANNEREFIKTFYVADSGWREGLEWLNQKAAPALYVNITSRSGWDEDDENRNNVRNYGDGEDGVLNDDWPNGTEDGILTGMPYWYKLTELSAKAGASGGQGGSFIDYEYRTTSIGDRKHGVEVVAVKTYKQGQGQQMY